MLNSNIDGPHSKSLKLLIKLFRNIEYAITHFKMIHLFYVTQDFHVKPDLLIMITSICQECDNFSK